MNKQPLQENQALLVVDMQNDFLPGGALGVENAHEIVAPVSDIMNSDTFSVIVATQDWHPARHVSFASVHEGKKPMDSIQLYEHEQTLWPDHCVQDSKGAALHPALPWNTVSTIIRKGEDRTVDSYSGFRNNWSPDGTRPKTGLAGYLRDRNVTKVYVCGLARDVCVRWTVEDAVDEGFKTILLWKLSRSVQSENDAQLREQLQAKGVIISEQNNAAAI